jgi:hypothetical protein
MYLATLYKARHIGKQHPCAICIDRTRGRTQRLGFGYGVEVWLCPGHASVEFLTQRSGRDLVVTLSGIWHANGCMTTSRHRALDAHLASLRVRPARPRPGSYAWPRVRVRCEQLFAAEATVSRVAERVLRADYASAEPPSRRTIQRWRSQRRWVRPPPANLTASSPPAGEAPAPPGSRPGSAPA